MTAAALDALGQSPGGPAQSWNEPLRLRFAQLHTLADGGTVDAAALGQPRAALRSALQPLEGSWHDGDENLVRGLLEGWAGAEADRPAAVAGRLLAAGQHLVEIGARREAWWFYLWEMESLLALVGGQGRC